MSIQTLERDSVDPGGAAHGFPGRTAYLIMAIAVMVFAVYGSLIPFDLRIRPFEEGFADFRHHLLNPPRRVSRSDFLANILLFVPIGFGFTGGLLLGRRRALILPGALVVLVCGLAVSVTAEFLQVFAPGRVSSRYDIIAQTLGCLVGIICWFAAGRPLTAWVRSAAATGHGDRLARVLTGYVAVWVFINLAPFNVTYDLGELARRVRTGRITLTPFGGYDGTTVRMLWDALITTISAVPLGLFGLVVWQQRTFRHGATFAFLTGTLIVVFMEGAHVFIRSHSADTADVIFGCLGVAVGVSAGARLLSRDVLLPGNAALRLRMRLGAAALLAWAAVLCAYHWLPYDFSADSQEIRRKLGTLSLVPFAGYHSGSAISAFNNLLTRIGLSMPVGILLAAIMPRRPPAIALIATAIAVIGLFGVIEAGQLFLPTRVPDPTDVLVGLAGSMAGWALGRWMLGGRVRDGA